MHPDTPEDGLVLADYFRGRGFDVEAMHARMKKLMDAEGLPYGQRERTFNSRLAQELGKWGESLGNERIHDALFRAYFVDGINLAKPDALAKVAANVGLDETEARRVLVDRTFKDAVDADWARARRIGVTGVPTFVIGNQGVVGAQPYDELAAFVEATGTPRR